MTPHDLLANFEVLAEAPNGIQRLRELVLELAVRGRLVEQDSGDGPVVAYVKQIAAEKTVLVKQGRLRNQKASQPVLDAEAPFQIHSSWVWLRAEDLFLVVTDGDHQPPPKAEAGVPFLVIGNVSTGKIDFAGSRFVPQTYFDDLDWTKQPIPKDLLYTVTGSFGIVVEIDSIHPFCVQRHIAILKSPACAFAPFLALALRSPNAYAFATTVATGTAQKTVPLNGLRRMPIPVPPLAEQRRIVARVDELMALLDLLEAKRQEGEIARVAARDSALATLRDARTPEDVEVAWLRVQEQFHGLFATPEDVHPLRKAILHLAARGRLVSQDKTEQPAIRTLQNRALRTAGAETPWDLPTGWSWTTLARIGEFQGGGTPSKSISSYWSGDIPWVSPKDMKKDLIDGALDHISPEAISGSATKLIPSNSLLMVVRGMILAHTFPVGLTTTEVTINQDMKALIPFMPEIAVFLHFLLKASATRVLDLVEHSTHGTCKLRFDMLANMPIPFPPLAEQQRILDKASTLLAACDRLVATLRGLREGQERFSTAAIHYLEA